MIIELLVAQTTKWLCGSVSNFDSLNLTLMQNNKSTRKLNRNQRYDFELQCFELSSDTFQQRKGNKKTKILKITNFDCNMCTCSDFGTFRGQCFFVFRKI